MPSGDHTSSSEAGCWEWLTSESAAMIFVRHSGNLPAVSELSNICAHAARGSDVRDSPDSVGTSGSNWGCRRTK